MVDLLSCGHSAVFLYSIRDLDGVRKKFCIGCLMEKAGLKGLNGEEIVNKKADYDEKVKRVEDKAKEKLKGKETETVSSVEREEEIKDSKHEDMK